MGAEASKGGLYGVLGLPGSCSHSSGHHPTTLLPVLRPSGYSGNSGSGGDRDRESPVPALEAGPGGASGGVGRGAWVAYTEEPVPYGPRRGDDDAAMAEKRGADARASFSVEQSTEGGLAGRRWRVRRRRGVDGVNFSGNHNNNNNNNNGGSGGGDGRRRLGGAPAGDEAAGGASGPQPAAPSRERRRPASDPLVPGPYLEDLLKGNSDSDSAEPAAASYRHVKVPMLDAPQPTVASCTIFLQRGCSREHRRRKQQCIMIAHSASYHAWACCRKVTPRLDRATARRSPEKSNRHGLQFDRLCAPVFYFNPHGTRILR